MCLHFYPRGTSRPTNSFLKQRRWAPSVNKRWISEQLINCLSWDMSLFPWSLNYKVSHNGFSYFERLVTGVTKLQHILKILCYKILPIMYTDVFSFLSKTFLQNLSSRLSEGLNFHLFCVCSRCIHQRVHGFQPRALAMPIFNKKIPSGKRKRTQICIQQNGCHFDQLMQFFGFGWNWMKFPDIMKIYLQSFILYILLYFCHTAIQSMSDCYGTPCIQVHLYW